MTLQPSMPPLRNARHSGPEDTQTRALRRHFRSHHGAGLPCDTRRFRWMQDA